MTDYASLGIRPVINAFATVTKYGGSLMPEEVMQAMKEASQSFVDLVKLQEAVGQQIATLTHNEAAYVTSGAAAGVMLSAAACVAIQSDGEQPLFPQASTNKEIIIYRSHRNGYDYGINQAGFTVIEIEPTPTDLKQAINQNTSAFFWFQNAQTNDTEMHLEQVIDIAQDHAIPVIVDAAAQLPPVDNLWRYTQMGAALAIFSGGKDLRGPQSSGLILGQRDILETIQRMSNPHHGVGRIAKVGKEELMGTLAAVERYLKIDHDARSKYCEDTVQMWCQRLNDLQGVSAVRDFPNEALQPLPWCRVTIDPDILGKDCNIIVQQFLDHDPAIAVSPLDAKQFHLNPMTLNKGEEHIVLDACLDLLVR